MNLVIRLCMIISLPANPTALVTLTPSHPCDKRYSALIASFLHHYLILINEQRALHFSPFNCTKYLAYSLKNDKVSLNSSAKYMYVKLKYYPLVKKRPLQLTHRISSCCFSPPRTADTPEKRPC